MGAIHQLIAQMPNIAPVEYSFTENFGGPYTAIGGGATVGYGNPNWTASTTTVNPLFTPALEGTHSYNAGNGSRTLRRTDFTQDVHSFYQLVKIPVLSANSVACFTRLLTAGGGLAAGLETGGSGTNFRIQSGASSGYSAGFIVADQPYHLWIDFWEASVLGNDGIVRVYMSTDGSKILRLEMLDGTVTSPCRGLEVRTTSAGVADKLRCAGTPIGSNPV